MKIFVSEKEEMFELLENYSGLETLQCGFETSQRPIFQTRLKIKSLEQHDRELLREFAEKLKYTIRLNNSDEETGELAYVVDINCLFEDIDELLEEPVCKENIINELLKERGV